STAWSYAPLSSAIQSLVHRVIESLRGYLTPPSRLKVIEFQFAAASPMPGTLAMAVEKTRAPKASGLATPAAFFSEARIASTSAAAWPGKSNWGGSGTVGVGCGGGSGDVILWFPY